MFTGYNENQKFLPLPKSIHQHRENWTESQWLISFFPDSLKGFHECHISQQNTSTVFLSPARILQRFRVETDYTSNFNTAEQYTSAFLDEWEFQPRKEMANIGIPPSWPELIKLPWHFTAFFRRRKDFFLSGSINLLGKPSLEVTRSKMSNTQLYEAEHPAKIYLLRDRWQMQPGLWNYSCVPEISQIYVCDH